jgi:hypothetical protein
MNLVLVTFGLILNVLQQELKAYNHTFVIQIHWRTALWLQKYPPMSKPKMGLL